VLWSSTRRSSSDPVAILAASSVPGAPPARRTVKTTWSSASTAFTPPLPLRRVGYRIWVSALISAIGAASQSIRYRRCEPRYCRTPPPGGAQFPFQRRRVVGAPGAQIHRSETDQRAVESLVDELPGALDTGEEPVLKGNPADASPSLHYEADVLRLLHRGGQRLVAVNVLAGRHSRLQLFRVQRVG